MSELDSVHLVLDRYGVAHGVALTRNKGGAVAGWHSLCGCLIEAGEDRTWTSDCEACREVLRIQASRRDTERRAAEKRQQAIDAAERATELKRRGR